MKEIEYCKDCEYFHPENEVYDCHCQEPYNTDRAWGFAKSRVCDYSTCVKYNEEVSNIPYDIIKEYIMPFGKFKGVKFKDINEHYIYWLHKQDWLKMPLKLYIDAYYLHLQNERNSYCSFESPDPYDVCPFNGYNEMGYGELC